MVRTAQHKISAHYNRFEVYGEHLQTMSRKTMLASRLCFLLSQTSVKYTPRDTSDDLLGLGISFTCHERKIHNFSTENLCCYSY
jgi:hypothetical protein